MDRAQPLRKRWIADNVENRPAEDVHERGRDESTGDALQHPFDHERQSDEPVSRADEFHHFDLAPTLQHCELDLVEEQQQRTDQQNPGAPRIHTPAPAP